MTSELDAKRRTFTRSEWALILLLALINFAHILDFVIIMPLGDQMRSELQISPQQFGYIVSAYGLMAAIAGLTMSAVVDRFDRKTVLLVSFGGFIFATLLCGLAPNFTMLLSARGLAGTFGGVAASLVLAVVGDVFPNQRRGKAIGVVTSAFAFASIVGLPIGLTLANWYGRGAPFIAISLFSVGIFLAMIVRLPSLTQHRGEVHARPIQQFKDVLKQPNHLRSFLFMFLLVLGTFTIIPYIAPYMQANCGRTKEEIPLIYAIAGCCTLVSMYLIGVLTDRVGQRPMFLVMACGAIVMTLVMTHLPAVSLGTIILVTIGFMVCASGRVIPGQAMMLRTADPKLRGAFTNINSAVSHLATGLAPLISGAIIGEEYKGGPLTHYGTAGLVAIGFGAGAIICSYFLTGGETSVAKPVTTAVLEPSPV